MRQILLYIWAFLGIYTTASAQTDSLETDQTDTVRISGVVISADSLQLIPDVVISGKHTLPEYAADTTGIFSFTAHPGDTITFTSLGYKVGMLIIPEHLQDSDYTLVQTLIPDSVDVQELYIYPLPSAEEFVRSFHEEGFIYADMDEALQENMEQINEMEPGEYLMNKYQPEDINFGYGTLYNNRMGHIPANNILNPLRWKEFINDLQELRIPPNDE